MPRYVNSLDKIVFSYLAAVCKESFTYKKELTGKEFQVHPKPLQISPQIFRGFICPPDCGGCCPRFSLEYLPSEVKPQDCVEYEVYINDRSIALYHDPQDYHDDHHCRHLDKENARCLIHPTRPFHCDFELIRVFISKNKNRLNQQMFGRGWQFLRIDGGRGAQCTITPPDVASVIEVVRKLKRLKEWTDHFHIDTWLDDIIPWAASGPHTKPLYLTTKEQLADMVEIVKND